MKLEMPGLSRSFGNPFGLARVGLAALGCENLDPESGTCLDSGDSTGGALASSADLGSGSTFTAGGSTGGTPTCYAYGSDNSCLSYTTDGGMTTVGCGTSTSGPCAPNGSIIPSGSAPAGAAVPVNSLLASIQNMFKPSPMPTSAAACAAAKGVWNGATCSSANSLIIGGMAISTTTVIIGVVALFLLTKKGR